MKTEDVRGDRGQISIRSNNITIESTMTERMIVNLIAQQMIIVKTHEVFERFRYKGELHFKPHEDDSSFCIMTTHIAMAQVSQRYGQEPDYALAT
jgi:hypothetical protein